MFMVTMTVTVTANVRVVIYSISLTQKKHFNVTHSSYLLCQHRSERKKKQRLGREKKRRRMKRGKR